jgi:choline dehydrogenase-like flavoprotein
MLHTSRGTSEVSGQLAYDIVIVGSGPGGGTLAYSLKDVGARVLVIERGPFLAQEAQNWDARAVFSKKRYRTTEQWEDRNGKPFRAGTYYYVGGNSKFYGASLPRFRREDFLETTHADGTSPAWPITYDDMAPYYTQAEQLYRVHGWSGQGDDPTLERETPYPFPAIKHEDVLAQAADRLRRRGYTPSHLPLGIERHVGGSCLRTSTCDGFPCKIHAKSDAEVRAVRPALASGNVDLLTEAFATRILTSADGVRATGVEVEHSGETLVIRADRVVVAAGAVNSAALLLRSANGAHPQGLANASGQVGRNYMVHNNSIMLAVRPIKKNLAVFHKTLYVNDFYLHGTKAHPYPLGHIQVIGRVRKEMVEGQKPPSPGWARDYLTDRALTWWLFTEDLPREDNRVTLGTGGRIRIDWTANNVRAHQELVKESRKIARASGFPITIVRRAGIDVSSHQSGTARMGADPARSVLDASCRSHDVANLFVADASVFPSLPVMNPALTIMANALRVGEALRRGA